MFRRLGGGSGSRSRPLATSLENYVLKAQIMDYKATRAQFEGFAARWNADRPATGLIYWMLNNAWPSLHWNLFDYYLRPAGSYFSAKVGARPEHVAYDYVQGAVYIINRSLDRRGQRTVEAQFLSLDGKVVSTSRATVSTEPNTSKRIPAIAASVQDGPDVVLLRLVLAAGQEANNFTALSRNVYWLARDLDVLDWPRSTWYHTPVTRYANLSALNTMPSATVAVTASPSSPGARLVRLENKSTVPAVFVRLNLVDGQGADVTPVFWSDNYVTLWPGETLELEVSEGPGPASSRGRAVEVSGKNVASATVPFQ